MQTSRDLEPLISAMHEIADALKEQNNEAFSFIKYLQDPGFAGAFVTFIGIGVPVIVAYNHVKKQFTLHVVSEFYHGTNIKTRINKIMDYIIGKRESFDADFEHEFNELSSFMPTIRHAVIDKFVNEGIIKSYFESHFAAIVIAAEKLNREGKRELLYSPRTSELLVRWGIIDSEKNCATRLAHLLIEERFRAKSYKDREGVICYNWYQRLR